VTAEREIRGQKPVGTTANSLTSSTIYGHDQPVASALAQSLAFLS